MTACASCGTKVNPGDRFCASCGAPLEQRCATCGTVLPSGARFCPSCGTAVAAEDAATPTDRGGEERKIVSVLFADLVGFTASSDGADPEDVGRRLRPFHAAMRAQVERFGGRIEKLMGDGVLAVFGAPTVHEDDAERAVRAGLSIQEAVAELTGTTGLTARVAVATGEAVVMLDGTTTEREGLVGDVVNTASRLQNEAPPGAVLIDEATYRATRRVFRYEERSPVAVKGKSEPLAVWIALEPTGRFGSDVEDEGAAFVGRTSELALMIDAFTRATHSRTGQIVTIIGEPGVGKSRLVRELRRHVDELPDLTRWRQGRCLPYGEGITYWALGEIAKAEAGIFETDTPATALGKLATSLEPLLPDGDERVWVTGRLAPLVGSGQETVSEQAERFAAWHRYLTALAEQRPTVVVIEDLHWADRPLIDFLTDLPEAARDVPLLLVCTARPDFFETYPSWGGGLRNAVTVRLEPLGADDTRTLLDDLLAGEDLDERARRLIAERTGGNPLWAQEFVRMLNDRPGAATDLAIPDSVQAVVASRIDLLDPDTKTAIQAASTIGKSFWLGAVEALLDEPDDLIASLRELTRRELIRRERVSTVAGETEYAFTHSVVRDVAMSQAPRAVRADRHLRAARWIEAMAGDRMSDRAELVAHHDAEALRLASAADLPDVTRFSDAAVASHRRAAAHALDATARRTHLEAALELTPIGDPRRGRLLYDLGLAIVTAGLADVGKKTLMEARAELDAAGDLEGWGQATAKLAQTLWISGEGDEGLDLLDEAIAVLSAEAPGPALATVFSHKAGALWLRGAPAEALDFAVEIRHIVETYGDLEARKRMLSADGGARFDAGDPRAVESFRQVLRMAIEADDSLSLTTAHLNLGEQLRTGWGMAEATAVHQRGLEIALQRHTAGSELFLRFSLADDYFQAGRWDDAVDQIETALAMPDRLSYLEFGIRGLGGVIHAARSGTEPGEGLVGHMVAEATSLKDLQAVIPAFYNAMWILSSSGDAEGALGYARRIVEEAGATRFLFDAWPLTVCLLHRAGELGRIAELLPELRRFDMPRPQALLRTADALLLEASDPVSALTHLEQGVSDLAGLGAAVDAAIVAADGARLADNLGDPDRARRLRDQAGELMSGTGATAAMQKLGLA